MKKKRMPLLMSGLSIEEADLLLEVGLNPDDTWDTISEGAQNTVRRYKENQVVKLPIGALRRDWLSRIKNCIMGQTFESVQNFQRLCEQYIPGTVPADILPGLHPSRFASLQNYKSLERIHPSKLQQSSEKREEFLQILKGNGKMHKETGWVLDVSGWDPDRIIKGRGFTNNIWDDAETKKMCVVDTGLLHPIKHILQVTYQRYNAHNLGFDFFGKEAL